MNANHNLISIKNLARNFGEEAYWGPPGYGGGAMLGFAINKKKSV